MDNQMTRRELLDRIRQLAFTAGLSAIPVGLSSCLAAETGGSIGSGFQSPVSPEDSTEDDLTPRLLQEPFPHLKDTAPLLPLKQAPWPKAMTYPQSGNIYAVQLQEENSYWLKEIAATPHLRDEVWHPDFSSVAAYQRSISKHRQSLRDMLGLLQRPPARAASTVLAPAPLRVEDLTLEIDQDFQSRALLFAPSGPITGAAVIIPDADESCEEFAGIVEGNSAAPWLTSLLEKQLVVCVPVTVERKADYPLGEELRGFVALDRRKLLFRLGFIVGRTLVGLEVDQVLALKDYISKRFSIADSRIALAGIGQGAMTAFYAAAADPRVWGAVVINYLEKRESCWQEPADRMLYGQLSEFGDAEVAALIAPRPLIVAFAPGDPISTDSVNDEVTRATRFYAGLQRSHELMVTQAPRNQLMETAATQLVARVGAKQGTSTIEIRVGIPKERIQAVRDSHFEKLRDYLRRLDAASDQTREDYWKLLTTPASERAAKAEQMRTELAALVGSIGGTEIPLEPRTKLIRITDKFTAYEVLLDAVPGVHAYGQLLVPRGKPGRKPVVICQHGLGGKPGDMTGLQSDPFSIYRSLGMHLANLGYVVFAPYMNVPVRQEDLIEPLVRMAAALGKMRTSLELTKLHRIVDFLQSLPDVDPGHIGYYGLSYGGYAAMWMPPLEPRIKASIISGNFNDRRAKLTEENAVFYVPPGGGGPYFNASYLRNPTEDMYNWNLLNRFTDRELIASMWPRSVCVEFGEHDPTTTPQWHEHAWKEVTEYKAAWDLEGLNETVVRVHYDGVHEIHGIGTFDFLNRWLRPDLPVGRDHSYNELSASINALGFAPEPQGPPGHALTTGQPSSVPLVTHKVDTRWNNSIIGRFYVSGRSPLLSGFALKASRVGNPGDLIVRFGSSEGADDLGEARIAASIINPLFDLWYEARIQPVKLDSSKLYFFQVTSASGQAPEDYYVIYGPAPLGGKDIAPRFGLAYRILGPNESLETIEPYERFGFMREMLAPYHSAVIRGNAVPQRSGEMAITSRWTIRSMGPADEVLPTAVEDLRRFVREQMNFKIAVSSNRRAQQIEIRVAPSGVQGVKTEEGYRIDVRHDGIGISALSSRGALRAVYELEDRLRLRRGPFLSNGSTVRDCRFSRRITTAVHPAKYLAKETSAALPYTDGLLQHISHSGFNALWVILNTEEATMASEIFPELSDSLAAVRLARLDDLTHRAAHYGIDVYIYLATGYNHHIPESFFQKHPETRGYGWGPPLCTSTPSVRKYYQETVRTIFRQTPRLKGMVVIYDSEGFWYCGNSDRNRLECPRCRFHSQEFLASQLLTTLNEAMHEAGGPSRDLVAWNYNYNSKSEWFTQEKALKVIPLLSKDIIIQPDFDKGMIEVKNGIRDVVEDYSISNLGPPKLFIDEYKLARSEGKAVMAKTENSVSQEYIAAPYLPCMEQWYQRIARIREYELGGWFGNWDHYGYTPSRPAELINKMSFDPAPTMRELLAGMVERDFGPEASPYVQRAWHHFSEGIAAYPYSDPVARLPGPIERGPSQPLFLNPEIKSFGPWRSWQNDLKWTAPWGPEKAREYLGVVERQFTAGVQELERAQSLAPAAYHPAILAEWRVARTIQASLRTVLNLIDWIQARERFYAAESAVQKEDAADQLRSVALKERKNAREILPLLEADSSLGCAAVAEGGLFTPALVRWKIGYLDDVLIRQLPSELKGRSTPRRAGAN